MNKSLLVTAPTILLSGFFLISGCSSEDNSSGGGSNGGATVPSNAILIDNSSTAETALFTAAFTGVAVSSSFVSGVTVITTPQDIIESLLSRIDASSTNTTNIVTGVDLSSEFCPDGGSAEGSEVETNTSYVASINLNACADGPDTLTGNFSANSTFSATTGPYSTNLSGNLTIVDSSGTSGFNGFSFIVSGDTSTGAYTTTAFTFSFSPPGGGGFLTQLTQPLVGNENLSCELTGGQLLITGASGSQARATINGNGSAVLEYHNGDGNFVPTNNSPQDCFL